MSDQIKVLLLDGHTVQALAMAKTLRKHKHYRVTVMCEDRLSFGYMSRFPHQKVICPKCIAEPEKYLENLIDFLNSDPHHVTIPLFNDKADLVSKHKARLSKYTKVQIPDYDIFIRGYDKELTMEACRNAGIPHPRTMNPEKSSYDEVAEYVKFPALIKPNIAAGARGITFLESFEDLKNKFPEITKEYGPSTVQEFVPQTGRQYKVQLFRDENGIIRGKSIIKKIRYFPISGGSSCYNITEDNPEIEKTAIALLDELKWVGFADFDFIEDPRDGLFKVMEINPRIPACIRSACTSGVDFADVMVKNSLGETDINAGTFVPGSVLRYMSLEILWFLFSKDRFTAKPSWFKFFGRNIYYQDGSWDDPLPMLVGFLLGIRKYLDPNFRKAKLAGKKK